MLRWSLRHGMCLPARSHLRRLRSSHLQLRARPRDVPAASSVRAKQVMPTSGSSPPRCAESAASCRGSTCHVPPCAAHAADRRSHNWPALTLMRPALASSRDTRAASSFSTRGGAIDAEPSAACCGLVPPASLKAVKAPSAAVILWPRSAQIAPGWYSCACLHTYIGVSY